MKSLLTFWRLVSLAFEAFSASAEAANLTLEWNYYNDGKAWLCKVLSKKKNLAWLVVYQNYFRTTSYFTEKHLDRIADMEITESIKEEFYRAKPSGKLIPMSVVITEKEQVKGCLVDDTFQERIKINAYATITRFIKKHICPLRTSLRGLLCLQRWQHTETQHRTHQKPG